MFKRLTVNNSGLLLYRAWGTGFRPRRLGFGLMGQSRMLKMGVWDVGLSEV